MVHQGDLMQPTSIECTPCACSARTASSPAAGEQPRPSTLMVQGPGPTLPTGPVARFHLGDGPETTASAAPLGAYDGGVAPRWARAVAGDGDGGTTTMSRVRRRRIG
jgi:hypothetical protein